MLPYIINHRVVSDEKTCAALKLPAWSYQMAYEQHDNFLSFCALSLRILSFSRVISQHYIWVTVEVTHFRWRQYNVTLFYLMKWFWLIWRRWVGWMWLAKSCTSSSRRALFETTNRMFFVLCRHILSRHFYHHVRHFTAVKAGIFTVTHVVTFLPHFSILTQTMIFP